ncbi:MAG: hypothetical protein ACKOBU_08855 [Gammaproteobacteria bacterium]
MGQLKTFGRGCIGCRQQPSREPPLQRMMHVARCRDMLESEACECYQAGLEVVNLRRMNGQYPRRSCERVTIDTTCWDRETPVIRRK